MSLLSALANGLILTTALTALLWLALRLTPRRNLNAATRYVVWWVTLAAVLVIPLAPLISRPVPRPARESRASVVTPSTPVPRVLPRVIPPRLAIAIPIVQPAKPLPTWPLWLWPALSVTLLIRLAVGYRQLGRLKARAMPLRNPRLQSWLRSCRGTRPDIELAVSSEIATPIAAGPHSPTILIPAALMEHLDDEDLDRIGLHETAHLVRRDDYALLVQRILERVFIVYPLVAWIARRIDLEREIACDDLVIAATGGARLYAECLTRIVTPSPWPAAPAAGSFSELAVRVDALLDRTRRAGAHLMKAHLAAVSTLLFALALMATRAPALIAFVNTVAAAIPHRIAAPIRPLPAASEPQSAVADDVSGDVKEEGTGSPIPAAELRFRKPGVRELAADLETDRQGRFSAAGLAAGQYSVEVVKANYGSTTFQLTVPAPKLSLRLVHYSAIDGSIVNSEGRPLAARVLAVGGRTSGSTRVIVLTKDPTSGQLVNFREANVEDEGHYRAFGLPPGRYAIGLWYSGMNEGTGMQIYPDTTHPRFFEVKGGEEFDHIDFTVVPHPAAQIGGRIQLPEGVTGQFQLALGLPDQPLLPFAQTLSEKDGSFLFEKIPPGTYDLFAAGPVGGYGQFESIPDAKADPYFGRATVQSAGQNVEGLSVAVAPGKSLRVTLKEPLPAGCPATVKVNVASLEPWAILFFGSAELTPGKEQAIAKLAPGLFRIEALELGANCFQTNDPVADLRADAPEPVSLELAAAGIVRGKASPASAVPLT
jgi:beta-lactamase regulating signal transducer with metallopeptidase domain